MILFYDSFARLQTGLLTALMKEAEVKVRGAVAAAICTICKHGEEWVVQLMKFAATQNPIEVKNNFLYFEYMHTIFKNEKNIKFPGWWADCYIGGHPTGAVCAISGVGVWLSCGRIGECEGNCTK